MPPAAGCADALLAATMTAVQWLPRGYTYIRELGAGAFGEVALARHDALDRFVAVKRIHRAMLYDDEALQRFRREGLVLAGLHHSAVVRVYDFKIMTDNALLIMEFVPGQPLSDLVEAGALAAGAALTVLGDVAGALAAAAAAGVIHRDVKPGNVFVLPQGRAKLGDFGLARVVADPSVFRTTDGQAGGTPAYFPPEVSQGADPDERSDAYSFAVMAYEVLTGRQPFVADGAMATIAAHWHQHARAPHEFIAGFPPAASAALLAGLDREPARRPLPVALITSLTAIPMSEWPDTVTQSPAPAAGGMPAAATTRRVPVLTPGPPPPALPAASRARHRRRLILAICTVVVIVTAAVLSKLLLAPRSKAALDVRSVSVVTHPDPPQARCPSAQFDFVAVIATNGSAGELQVQWTRPDGRQSTVQTISVRSGQRSVSTGLRFTVSGPDPLRGVAVAHVLAPAKLDASSVRIAYGC
ncbi:MAG: hypothetical protein DLM58_17165 [Pseudonocardiales bacterium]|nr:MAG: hypothetical protein DLM58_17165 [Pseudonocardiales bacterium]